VLRNYVKWLLFPGINLHARLRYRVLPKFIPIPGGDAEVTLLDAGCGNGMLTYQAYRRGYRALGVSIKSGEVERNQRLFNRIWEYQKNGCSFGFITYTNCLHLKHNLIKSYVVKSSSILSATAKCARYSGMFSSLEVHFIFAVQMPIIRIIEPPHLIWKRKVDMFALVIPQSRIGSCSNQSGSNFRRW
jgi:SAM-dependent methyltransferase